MLTATVARAQQLALVLAVLLVGAGMALCPGCYQAPPQTSSGDYSSSPAATPTDSTTKSPNVVGNVPIPNPINANVAQPNLAVGTMTLTPASNPYICLGARTVAAGAPVALSTCNQGSNQLWLLQRNRLKLSDSLCLSFPATGTAALKTTPVLASCNANDVSQTVMRGETAGFAMNSYGANYGIAAQIPTASNSNVTFDNLDPNQLSQQWVMGSDNAAGGTLQTGGFRLSSQGNVVQCLTVTNGVVSFTPCTTGAAATQSLRWNEHGQIVFGTTCLSAVAQGPCTMALCNAQDANQRWLNIAGQLAVASALGCLNPNDASIMTCPTDSSGMIDCGIPASK